MDALRSMAFARRARVPRLVLRSVGTRSEQDRAARPRRGEVTLGDHRALLKQSRAWW